jgi:TonB-dependent receptor
MFNKNKLSVAIISLLAAGSSQVFAQDAPVVEEVVVTGIRASVQAAMDIKRDSPGVVDAISAEDMGKFPDTNLAESLQRITGVAIDRTNGEGSQITVRGFGPNFNMVTLNGRTMPGGSTYGGSSGADAATRGGNSRAFDFANLASESVSGVQVYKTGKANLTSGGIGATVNIATTRPLDNPGLNASVTGKAVHDTTVREGDDVTPEVSGLFSWTDDNEMFGVALTASYQERDSGYTGATVNDWQVGTWGAVNADGDDADIYNQGNYDAPIFVNAPVDGQLYARPNDIRYAFSDSSRERTNTQLTLQFAPVDSITGTLDFVYAQNTIEEFRGEVTNWVQNGSLLTAVVFDDSQVAVPTLISEDYRGGDGNGTRDIGFSQQYRSQENTLESVGLNLAWDLNDQFSINFDVHDSSMESLPTGPNRAGEVDVGLGAQVKQGKTLYYGGDLPSWSYDIFETDGAGNINNVATDTIDDCAFAQANPGKEFVTDCDAPGLVGLDAADISSSVIRTFSAEQTTDVTQLQLGGSWEFDDGRFDFGIDRSELETTTTSYNTNNNQVLGGWGASNPGEFEGADLFEFFDVTGEFDDFSTGASPAMGFRGDARAITQFLIDSGYYPDVGGSGFGPSMGIGQVEGRNTPSSSTIAEDTTAVFAQVSLEGEIGGKTFGILTGLRYETTDVTSTSSTPPTALLRWESDNDFQAVPVAGAAATVAENDYDAFLPSLDMHLNFSEDLVGRASFSKTIARPNLGSLNSAVSGFGLGGSTLNSNIPTADGSNPYLVPMESSNFDLSLEWYFDETSYVSAGFWEKRVINFEGTSQENLGFGILDQTAGPRARAAVEALEANSFATDDAWIFAAMSVLDPASTAYAEYGGNVANLTDQAVAEINDSPEYEDVFPQAGDPEMEFRMSIPVNNEEAKIHGLELAVQHFFGETGFGVMANYTLVRGDVKFDNNSPPGETQFALVGLSDTANLVLMYEKFGVQARLAYNWRDEFLSRTNVGAYNNPGYVEAHSQIDMNVSYDVTEQISVFFEGINLTEEDRREYARNEAMLWGLEDLGARYQVGARYTF